MGLPEFSVRRRVTITMMIGILIVVGGISFNRIGVDLLPEMEFPMLSVLTQYPGVASEDIETLLTKPIEEVAGTVKGVKEVRSFSQEGVSVVQLDLEWGTNLDVAAQDIRNSIGLLRDFLPEDIREPLVLKFDTTAMPVMFMGITSESRNTYQLRKLVEDTIKERLERLDGVASAWVMGGEQREILVAVDRDELQARGQSLTDIVMVLRAQNLNLPGGHIVDRHEELLVRSLGEFQDVDDIGRIVIGMGMDRKPVRLRDVARVSNVPKEARDYSRTAGLESILFIIMKESGANTLQVSDLALAEIEEAPKYLPDDVEFHIFFDSGEFIRKVTSRTSLTGLVGGTLAVLMILLFLRSFRPTLAIAIAIPLSVMIAFIPLYFVGYTLNMMTLGGFALGVGMLVDNSIVVIENIYRHIEAGETRRRAAALGAREVGNAIIAATLTTVVVFLPMVFMEGIPGQLAKGVASTVAFSLLASLLVALTIVPMLASVFFKDRASVEKKGGRVSSIGQQFSEGRVVIWFKRHYERVLRFMIGKWMRWAVVAGVVVLFLVSTALMVLLGAEFMPASDQEFISMTVELPVGTDLETTNRVVLEVEDKIRQIPELEGWGAFGGLSDSTQQDVAFGSADAGVNFAQVMIGLVEKGDRKRSSMVITDQLRKDLPDLEGAKIEFVDMNAQMFGSNERPVTVKIYGRDLDTLKHLSEIVAAEIGDIEGIRDVDTSMRQGVPELGIKINRERAGSYGLVVGQIAAEIQAAMLGTVATAYRTKGEELQVRVRYDKRFRSTEADIKNIPIKTPFGSHVRLMDVAEVGRGTGAVRIDRANQMRLAVVDANIMDRDLNSVVKDVKARLGPIEAEQFPSGYFTDFGGDYERLIEYATYMAIALALAILLVYMVMAAQFESFSQPFIVMFTLPLALIGVFLLLYATGNRFNVPSGMGLVMLAGIVVNNGIILIDYINQLRRRGIDPLEAVVEGAKTRLRPIFITSFTTIFGMLPMVLDQGEGAEMRGPMALTVIGGLLTSMVLTLVVVPAVYLIFDSIGSRILGHATVERSTSMPPAEPPR
ncbi:MAG: efflux RND transporter permease subunit [Deltaproteobacteria bacterium]|nr:efflux RND transporter permease subunit [Deltaproteobacteria bacterium]